ncbi:MAG TPA: hypothetical protein VGM84_13685 [Steroidobacteraceae bacterium]|jgi:hypothetical protein
MKFVLLDLLVVVLLFAGMFVAQEWGRRLGHQHRAVDKSEDKSAYGATEGAVFALLGLFLAFTFSGAGSRFDSRRDLVVREANAIGTAWLRISILPAARQAELRGLMRQYVDARLDTYRLLSSSRLTEAKQSLQHSSSLQQQMWGVGVSAAAESGQVPPFTLLLPALNDMFDIASTRTAAVRAHPPAEIYLMIVVLSLVSALYVGYGLAGRKVSSLIHTLGFAAVMCIVMYVILDLEFPRLGFIQTDSQDKLLVAVRESMK